MGRAVNTNGQHLLPVTPGLSRDRKAEERSGKEEGKKQNGERPYAPCLRNEAWLLGREDAAGLTPDPGLSYLASSAELDDAEPTSVSSPGNTVILSAGTALPALQHGESCALVPGDWEWCTSEVLEDLAATGNMKGRGGRAALGGGQGLPKT